MSESTVLNINTTVIMSVAESQLCWYATQLLSLSRVWYA